MPQIKTFQLEAVARFRSQQVREVFFQVAEAPADFSEAHVVGQSAVNELCTESRQHPFGWRRVCHQSEDVDEIERGIRTC